MENFTIYQKLFERCGQNTYLVTKEINGVQKRYILKKIECRDENFANQAFREVMQQKNELEDISRTIPVKEFRVYWEAKNSSIHICCLREIYDVNLMADLQKSFIMHSAVRERIVENYLCQMILTLEKCHKRNIYHRALKLSNVVKDKGLKSILLVDFLIDGTFQTNHKAWQAPELDMELQAPPDNEKIDVWGIGAVMLCVVCSIFIKPGEEFEKFLQSIKEDQKPLDDIWKLLTQKYTNEIMDIIQKMINPDPNIRPTIKSLKQESYIECTFRINDADEISKEKRKACIANFWSMPKPEKQESVLEFLSAFIDCEERVIPSFVALNKIFICQNSLDLKPEDKQLVLAAMKNHPNVDMVQILGFQLLLKFTSKCPSEDYLFSCQAVNTVVSILKVIPKDAVLKPILYEFLTFLSLSDEAAQSFGSHGGLQILIEMLRKDIDDPLLVQNSCRALWGLCAQDCNARIAAAEGIPADMCSYLKKYSKMPGVAKECIAVLFSLSTVPNVMHFYLKHHVIYMIVTFLMDNKKNPKLIALCCNTLKSFLIHATLYDDVMLHFRKHNILPLLVSIVWNNIVNPDIIQYCFTALTAIIADNEESAHVFLVTTNNDAKKHCGMQLVRKILHNYKDDAEVSRSICQFLEALTKFGEGCHHSNVYAISSWLSSMKNTFSRGDKELSRSCEKILKRLEKFSNKL